MADCCAIVRAAADAARTRRFAFRGRAADPFADAGAADGGGGFRAPCRDRSAAHDRRRRRRPRRAGAAARNGVRLADDDTWSDIFSRMLVEQVEPQLGQGRLTMLYEYPAPEAALARGEAGRSARRGAVRALCLRRGARERLRRTDRCRRAAPALRAAMDEKQRDLWRALSDRRGVSRRARRDAAGKRRRARLRPAGDAGHRRRRGSIR